MLINTVHATIRGLRRQSWLCGLVAILVTPNASALFIVNQPWARPARSGQSTEVYMNLTSTDAATLVAVHTDDAEEIVIRPPGKDARAVATLPMPAGTLVALAPGKSRLAMIKLKRGVKLGERILLTLTIEGADGTRQEIPVNAEARMRSPLDDERRAHAHKHAH
jgi:copper(I)-binding protein